MVRHQQSKGLRVGRVGLENGAEVGDGLVRLSGGQQEVGQVHAEREIVGKRRNSVSQARDHCMLVVHAATPVLFVCLVRSWRFYDALTAA